MNGRATPALALPLVLLVAVAFGSVGGHDFVGYDDLQYVVENPPVREGLSLAGVRWAFTSFHSANWHPVTWLSHMTDVEIFGLKPGGHHLVSAGLHALNTVLFFLVLVRLTGARWQSWSVAALFAVHPLHVESVAWVSERKDLLSTLMLVLALGAYLRYVRRPGLLRYGVVTALFSLGLMAKPMLVTFPFALLLLDWWPLGRLSVARPRGSTARHAIQLPLVIAEKAPFLLLSVISAFVTYRAQVMGGMVKPLEIYSLPVRLGNSLTSYVAYLVKALLPAGLTMPYAHPGLPSPVALLGAAMLLAGLTALALRAAWQRPYLIVGWFWYLGTLVPVIGIVQVGDQAMADRYTYVPLVGLFIAAAWWVGVQAKARPAIRPVIGAAAIAVLGILSALAFAQVGYWRDHRTLVAHTLSVEPENWMALTNMGRLLAFEGKNAEAERHLRQAIAARPTYANAYYGLATLLNVQSRVAEAIPVYERLLQINPGYDEAYDGLGVALARIGRLEEAEARHRQAINLNPSLAEARNNLGYVLMRTGRAAESVDHLREAVRLRPHFPLAHRNLGAALLQLGRENEARHHIAEAARQRSERPGAQGGGMP